MRGNPFWKRVRAIAIGLAFAGMGAAPAAAQDAVVAVINGGDVEQTLECMSSEGTAATFDASNSTVNLMLVTDPEIAPHTEFLWGADPMEGVEFDDEEAMITAADLPPDLTQVTLTVTYTDPVSGTVSFGEAVVEVNIVDTTPPTVAALSDPMILWPPNHKLHEVEFDLMVMDNCDPDPEVTLVSVTSSEPDNDTGDGNTVDDIQGEELGTDDRVVLLRAERKGNGSGREYTATYNVTDASGNSTPDEVLVLVPHDKGDLRVAKTAEKAAKKAAKAAERAAKSASKDAAKQAKQGS
jgi:hypothetical protein